jgi:hypothetical protein
LTTLHHPVSYVWKPFPISTIKGVLRGSRELTKAEMFRNGVEIEAPISNGVLLARASAACGQDPEKFNSVRTRGAGKWYFGFDDGSVPAVDIIEQNQPNLRLLTVQLPPSAAS